MGVEEWRLRRQLQALLVRKQDLIIAKPGVLGNPANGLVDVPGRPGYDYVRTGDEQIVGEYLNVRVPSRYDLPVYVGRDPVQPYVEQVLSIRQEAYIDAGYSPIPQIPPHAHTHEWPIPGDENADGSDLVYVGWRQIRNFRLYTDGVNPFRIYTDGGPYYSPVLGHNIWVGVSQVDLTEAVPTNGKARWVLIYLDGTGTLRYRAGAERPRRRISFEQDSPVPQVGELGLGWVLLYDGQTNIEDSTTRQDIIDGRYPPSLSSTVTPHNLLGVSHSDTQALSPPGDGQVIIGQDGLWRARNVEGDIILSPEGHTTVQGIQNIPVSSTHPADGDVLMYDGTAGLYVPQPCESGGGGGGGSDRPFLVARWYADGPVAKATEVGGVWVAPVACAATGVLLYAMSRGISGNTVVDVEYSRDGGNSWSSVYSDPLRRPSLHWNSSSHVVYGYQDFVLETGDLLRMNIVNVATGARCISVQVWFASAGSSSKLPILWADDADS